MMQTESRGPDAQWMVEPGGSYQMCGRTVPRLPAGAYTCTVDCYGNQHLVAKRLNVDDLIDFPDSLPSCVLREIGEFWKLGDKFRRYGFLHRRGYLFYGKQGGGKSSLVHQITSQIVTGGHVAFFCENPYPFIQCLETFRKVEPARPMVCVFEDVDAIIEQYGDSLLLQWLDGNHQVDKAVNLASTNYPAKLDRRIIARPRRFDRIHRIDAPEPRLRAAYFARKMPDQPAGERARWAQLSEGLPFAALAEMVISVQCLGNDVEETVALLRKLDRHAPNSGELEPEVEQPHTNGVAQNA